MAISAADFRELRLEGLSRDFGNMNALRDINLTVKRGEFIALLGPSGCGKSTTLNCLAGLLPVTGGGIFLDDRRIDRLVDIGDSPIEGVILLQIELEHEAMMVGQAPMQRINALWI